MVDSPVVLGPVVKQNIAYRRASLPHVCQETEREIQEAVKDSLGDLLQLSFLFKDNGTSWC